VLEVGAQLLILLHIQDIPIPSFGPEAILTEDFYSFLQLLQADMP
jgi:hypothetical protein